MKRARDLGLTPIEEPAHWERYYQKVSEPLEMPWTCPLGLDPDFERVLRDHAPPPGARVLDVGTGSGNQALELARRGFDVTGSDLAPSAVRAAEERAREAGVRVRYVQDDVLATRLRGPFDLVLDRACFQVLDPAARERYADAITALLAPGGLFVLKAFSDAEPRTDGGPYRFSAAELERVFGARLVAQELVATRHQGTSEEPAPLAWLGTWRRAR